MAFDTEIHGFPLLLKSLSLIHQKRHFNFFVPVVLVWFVFVFVFELIEQDVLLGVK